MTYQEQLLIIKQIPIRDGDTKVITCPFCYQPKKLALSNIDGKLMWNCYRASCNAKGIHSGRRNLSAVKNYLSNQVQSKTIIRKPIPSMTTSIGNHQPAIDYLKTVNSLDAYESGLIKIRYAPAEDRVLFYGAEGAVGRSLKRYGPKWISYGLLTEGIHVGSGSTAVLVEDVPSACSVSRIPGLVGVALLGTNFTLSLKKSVKKYNIKIIILDKDASKKAILITRSSGENLVVRFTKYDLKLLTKDQIMALVI
tara:strand:- start:6724 stop:7482 length:759 start_codon:yes stop_codon:yes gene_type:complete